jgi:hypothetical protein
MNKIVTSRLPKFLSIALLGASLLAPFAASAQEANTQSSVSQSAYPQDGLHPSPSERAESWR